MMRVFLESGAGKETRTPEPQPWQGYALPTELFPYAAYNTTTKITGNTFVQRKSLVA